MFRDIRSNFSFLFRLSMKFIKANIASHLRLFCLPICPIKRTSGLYGLKLNTYTTIVGVHRHVLWPKGDTHRLQRMNINLYDPTFPNARTV